MSLKRQILQDPHYRFRNLQEIALGGELGISIDVATATVDDWLRLPGISIRQAQSLVELRSLGVEIFSIEDLAAALSLPVSRVQGWQPVLSFCYYDPSSTISPPLLNPNTATLGELTRLPILDSDTAELIYQERLQGGNYQNLADFQRRIQCPGALISQLMHYLRF